MRVLTLSLFATLLSAPAFAPAFAADLGTYRLGTPYHSVVAPGADVCDSQCAGDAQCRGWNYVKANPRAPGICEFMSSISTPIASQLSISGENMSAASYASRVTLGATNTIRVGTQVSQNTNRVQVGQSPTGRRIVRQAPPTQRIVPQQASTKPVDTMSLTAQQNRYRQGFAHNAQTPVQAPVQQALRRPAPTQRPVFRQHLDAPYQSPVAQPQLQQPQRQQFQHQQQQQHQQAQQPQRQSSRRVTGPRRAPVQRQAPNAPQFQAPQNLRPQYQAPQYEAAAAQRPTAPQTGLRRGSPRPPIGKPIPPTPISQAPISQAPQPAPQALRSTPSQRLAQFTAQNRASESVAASAGPIALNPQQARKSLFGSLNDDIRSPEATPSDMPIATSVPTKPVTEQPLGEILAGGR